MCQEINVAANLFHVEEAKAAEEVFYSPEYVVEGFEE
jgi:hypothetical protein